MSEKRILIVETEKTLTPFMRDYFERRGPHYNFYEAGSITEALHVLRNNLVDLAVSEHQGPEGLDGLRFLEEIRQADLAVRVVLSADKTLEKDRARALSAGCVAFLLKDSHEDKVADLLFNMLQPIQGFTGRLVGMKLEDVIQMFCYRKDSSLLLVHHGDDVGSIYVDNGGIVHAECDNLRGVEAFYEIVGWETGEFLSQVVLSVPPRTLFIDWQSLLMEGMRQRDEIRHALAPVSSDDPGSMQRAVPGNGTARTSANGTIAFSRKEDDASIKRIMIVDDSRFIRKIVQEIVQSDSGLSVVGYATNGQEALSKIDELKPDLILLDWDMPVMKGSTTLMHIMIRSPCPVVILSGFVGGVGTNPFDLLCLGGVDFLRKPQNNWRTDGRAEDLVRRIKEACRIKFDRIRRVRIPAVVNIDKDNSREPSVAKFLSVFASSTGGCADLIRIIPFLREDLPSAVLVLHDMQQGAIGAFVDYLDRRSRIHVRCLEPGEPLAEGTCYVHPATVPAELERDDGAVHVRLLSDFPEEKMLDHFLVSASKVMRQDLIAVLLSGGPDRGIEGLRAVKQVEGVTMVQDPMSSVDPRMAEGAMREGLVDYTCLADNLAETYQNLIR
ncbi:MAG: chemotaxis protein CheB [Desulfomonilaceae bacterium]|nr:chemotaxis protein CheB [Desulfomonilaceae bacterium]